MKISIVTVVWNNPLVKTALESILSQKTQHTLELIVVDGGSSDGTLEALAPFRSRIDHFVSEPDKGIYDAMNKGLRLATGEVIGTLNADDLLSNDQVLETIGNAFLEHHCDAVFGDLVYVKQDDPANVIRYWRSGPFVPGSFGAGWMPPHPTLYLRANVYQKFGLFDLEFRLAADVELMLRLFEKYSINNVYIPSLFVRMRLGGATNQSLKNIMRGNLEIKRAFEKNEIPFPWTYPFQKVLSRLAQFFRKPATLN